MSMISHISIGVADLDRARAFYDAVLAPLGIVRVWAHEDAVGYGRPGCDDELALFARNSPDRLRPGPGFHVALRAPSQAAVEAFWTAAIATGGADEGAPGPRIKYGPNYYAAFVTDPDGYKLEAKLEPELPR